MFIFYYIFYSLTGSLNSLFDSTGCSPHLRIQLFVIWNQNQFKWLLICKHELTKHYLVMLRSRSLWAGHDSTSSRGTAGTLLFCRHMFPSYLHPKDSLHSWNMPRTAGTVSRVNPELYLLSFQDKCYASSISLRADGHQRRRPKLQVKHVIPLCNIQLFTKSDCSQIRTANNVCVTTRLTDSVNKGHI